MTNCEIGLKILTAGYRLDRKPPTSNRGVTFLNLYGVFRTMVYKTTRSIDWLSLTYETEYDITKVIPTQDTRQQFELQPKGMNGYAQKWIARNGAIVLVHGTGENNAMHVILSGQPMQQLRDSGLTDKEIVQYPGARKHHATRIDMCIDQFDGMVKPINLLSAWRTGKLKCPIRKPREYKEHVKQVDDEIIGGKGKQLAGHTAYFGAPTSDRIFRSYDKGAEQGIDINWIRHELVLRGVYTANALHDLQSDEITVGMAVNAHISAYIKWDNPHWQRIIKLASEYERPPRVKAHKTLEWIYTSVVPAMAKYIIEHGDYDLIARFDGLLAQELAERLKIQNDLQDSTGVEITDWSI